MPNHGEPTVEAGALWLLEEPAFAVWHGPEMAQAHVAEKADSFFGVLPMDRRSDRWDTACF